MATTSKNGNDVGVKNGNPTVVKHAVPKTRSMKIHNYRQSAILKLKEIYYIKDEATSFV